MANALRRVLLKGADGAASRVIWGAVEDPGPPAPGHSPAKKATTVWARESHPQVTLAPAPPTSAPTFDPSVWLVWVAVAAGQRSGYEDGVYEDAFYSAEDPRKAWNDIPLPRWQRGSKKTDVSLTG